MVEFNNHNINKSGKQGQLRWKCRRGLLELDKVLLPFLDYHYAKLSPVEKKIFERLLEEEDPTLQAWFMRIKTPKDKQLASMVEHIRSILKQQK